MMVCPCVMRRVGRECRCDRDRKLGPLRYSAVVNRAFCSDYRAGLSNANVLRMLSRGGLFLAIVFLQDIGT